MGGLLKTLNASLSGGPYYVRMSKVRISVRDACGDGTFSEEPIVALTHHNPPKVAAVGSAARASAAGSVNPFSHPRIIVADFIAAESLLRHAFQIVSGRRIFQASPVAVMHWVEELDGGLTDIERRVLHELAEGAGARKTYIWEGRELADEDLRSGVYETAT